MNSGKKMAVAALFVLAQFVIVSSLIAQEKPAATHAGNAHSAEAKLALREGWSLQTSAKVEAKGEVISTPRFAAKGWHAVTVPTTVVAALVREKALPDPDFGMNLRNFPGVNYPIGANFSNVAMA